MMKSDKRIINLSFDNLETQNYSLDNLAQNTHKLIDLYTKSGNIRKLKSNHGMSVAGIYCFWWTGDYSIIKDYLKHTKKYFLSGKYDKEKVMYNIHFNDKWIETSTKDLNGGKAVCLYIGKSTNIFNRLSKHLRVNVENIWLKTMNNKKQIFIEKHSGRKPNSESQLRVGFERLFEDYENRVDMILENVTITYIPIPGKENGIKRFYAETKAISQNFPIFNIDVER